jgi:protein-L-isoaspartate(D-aspartate) O-methyltransferase
MVEQQVRTWDVLDPAVLSAMETIPREAFAPEAYRKVAYADFEIPIGDGETMLGPKVEGRLLQALEIGADDRVLEIGTGTGYLTACLATLGAHVTSIERLARLVDVSRRNLERAGIANVSVIEADVSETLPDERFDVVAVSGSVAKYDERFQQRLKEGGRLFIVSGHGPIMQAWLVRRGVNDTFRRESLFETVLRPLRGFEAKPEFHF